MVIVATVGFWLQWHWPAAVVSGLVVWSLAQIGSYARRSFASLSGALANTTKAYKACSAENARLRRELALATEQRAAVVDSYRRVKAELEAVRGKVG